MDTAVHSSNIYSVRIHICNTQKIQQYSSSFQITPQWTKNSVAAQLLSVQWMENNTNLTGDASNYVQVIAPMYN